MKPKYISTGTKLFYYSLNWNGKTVTYYDEVATVDYFNPDRGTVSLRTPKRLPLADINLDDLNIMVSSKEEFADRIFFEVRIVLQEKLDKEYILNKLSERLRNLIMQRVNELRATYQQLERSVLDPERKEWYIAAHI